MRSLVRKMVFIIAAGLGLTSSLWLFRIDQIQCYLDTQVCPTAVTAALDSLQGHSLFFTDLAKPFVSQPALTQYQLVTVKKELPSTLQVTLVSYPTSYQLRFTNGPTYVVNAQRQLHEQSLPELTTIVTSLDPGSLTDGDQLHADTHHFITQLIQALAETHLEPTEIVLEEKSVVRIGLKGGINGIISNERIHSQVGQLAFIDENFDLMTIDQGLKVIDVRYTLPVLRTTYTW